MDGCVAYFGPQVAPLGVLHCICSGKAAASYSAAFYSNLLKVLQPLLPALATLRCLNVIGRDVMGQNSASALSSLFYGVRKLIGSFWQFGQSPEILNSTLQSMPALMRSNFIE